VLYRSAEADALALRGFTFGLDMVLAVGHLRLREHKTVDGIHQSLSEQVATLEQTISRREMVFLFEASTALLRAGTQVIHDEAWKEQVGKQKGIVLSIEGIQPDTGNETMYLMRDVLTGRILHAEIVTESTKERLKEILGPVVALNVASSWRDQRCSTNGTASGGGTVACCPPSDLPMRMRCVKRGD
jgi:hypothetical protein